MKTTRSEKLLNLVLILSFFVYYQKISGQISDNWMFQTAGFVVNGTTSSNPLDYSWSEVSNIVQGVHISILPAEKVPICIEQNNNYICFNTFLAPAWANEFIVNIDVNINNNGFYNIYNGSAKMSVVWFNSSSVFSSIGSYDLKVSITDVFYNIKHREYEIIVIKSSSKLFKDNFGNTLRLWEGSNSLDVKPIVFSEGFDAYDTNPQQMYYSAASELMSCLYDNGFDVFLLNNIYGTQDIRNNAAGLSSAISYISNLYGNKLVIAGGVSMGGMIARYALAKAEGIGEPLPVSIFLSVDSPQQGAVVSQALQDYKKQKQEGDAFAQHSLNNMAAKQLLKYSTYDPEGIIHQAFYSELNSLNGDGYPHLTKNIGVSFSTNEPNTYTGTWINIKWNSPPFQGEEASFNLSADEKLAGSYLPVDLTTTSPMVLRAFCWAWNFLIQPWNYPTVTITRTKHPAYIPYESALDIVNGISKFDVMIEPEQTTFHDILPSDIIDEIVNELMFMDVFLQNKTITTSIDYIGKNIYSGSQVNNQIPYGEFTIANGAIVSFNATEEIILSSGFIVESGAVFNAVIENGLLISCNAKHEFSNLPIQQPQTKKMQNKDPFRGSIEDTVDENEDIFWRQKNLSVYPNPSKGVFFVYLSNIEFIDLEIIVQDVFGNRIFQRRDSENPVKIDLSNNNPGIYFVKIKAKNKNFRSKIVLL